MATKPKKLKFEKYSFEGQVLHDLNKITAELKSLRRKEEKLMADLTALQAFVVEFSYSSYLGLPTYTLPMNCTITVFSSVIYFPPQE